MKLAELLNENRIIIELNVDNIHDAVAEMVLRLKDDLRTEKYDDLVKTLADQEQKQPTMIDASIWLPHLREPRVIAPCVCLATSENGIPLGKNASSQGPAKLIFLVLTPAIENTRMLQTLAGIARLCSNRDTVDALMHIKSAQRALRLIAETGIEVRKSIVVRDIMETDFLTLDEKMNLRQATDVLVSSRLNACPVVTKDMELLGDLSLRDLIRLGLPEYINMLEDLTFVESLEPFENFLRQERHLYVEQVYSSDVITTGADNIIVEAAYRLISKNKDQIYVIQDDKLIGVLPISSIVKKIFLL